MDLGIEVARRLAIRAQGLETPWELDSGKAGAAQLVERLGYVQIDTISVVARSHHHVLWTRQRDYEPTMIYELLALDKRVFEGWSHAASYLPMCDYRYSIPRMEAYASRPRTQQWLRENRKLVDDVLAQIRTMGPQGSADFKAPDGFKRGTWWSWKPAKRALEVLFSMGELMVAERRNFQRIYDLRERVLLPGTDVRKPSPDELSRFALRRALDGYGLATRSQLTWRRGAVLGHTIDELIASGEVQEVRLGGDADRPAYALTEELRACPPYTNGMTGERALYILSPFDNLVIHRGRLQELFGFEYRLEAYTPAAKRQYGYFVLPILWGDLFAGRVDCKADRKAKELLVRRLVLEPGLRDLDKMSALLSAKLWAFARFNGCERISVHEVIPDSFCDPLKEALSGESQ